MMIEVNGPLLGRRGFGRRCLGGHLSSHAALLFGESDLAVWRARALAGCAEIGGLASDEPRRMDKAREISLIASFVIRTPELLLRGLFDDAIELLRK